MGAANTKDELDTNNVVEELKVKWLRQTYR